MKRYLDVWTAEKCSVSELTRQAIDTYTVEKLRETIAFAVSRSSFYRERLEKKAERLLGCVMTDAQQFMTHFRELPFTDAQDLRTEGSRFLCVSPGKISRIVTLETGGSTGAPKRIYFTEEDQQLTVDYFQNGMKLLTDSSDKVLILMPAKIPGSVGKLLGQGLRNFGAATVEYGLPSMTVEQSAEEVCREGTAILSLMAQEGVTAVVALPSHMEQLAIILQQKCRREPDFADRLAVKSVLLSAEYVKEQTAALIEKAFQCQVYEHYGMTEMGLGCAVSCGQGEGYHVREADLYLEIIDPGTGRLLPDGAFGEVVFTTLTRTGMPFIRYRTGDYSRWISQACGCGSVLKRLDKVGPREFVKGYLK